AISVATLNGSSRTTAIPTVDVPFLNRAMRQPPAFSAFLSDVTTAHVRCRFGVRVDAMDAGYTPGCRHATSFFPASGGVAASSTLLDRHQHSSRKRAAAANAARLLAVVLALAIATAPVRAQGGNGQIEGVVRDEQAAVMPGATVTLRNQESGVTRVATTEADGHYRFPALLPGTYTVQVEIAGFTPQEVRDLTITIGLALSQDFTLKLRAVAESVTFTASPPVVDTTKSEVAGVVTPMQIQTLPINSRQYLSLALLMPGTSLDATRSFFATVNVGGSMTFNSTGNIVDGM